MSRRTRWFERFGRPGSSSSRTTKRAGRALGFEHCEPRIALSANATGGGLYFTTGAFLSEGGMIGFDVGPTGEVESDSLLSSGLIRNVADGADLVLAGVQPHGANVDFNHVISVGELFSDGSKVQQIAAPVGGVQQPEGGQIVIIDAPHGELAALARAESEIAQARASRPLLESSAAGAGVGDGAAREVEGLRGRAIVFEVAHAKIIASGRHAGPELDESHSDLAVDDAIATMTADRIDAAHRSTDITADDAAESEDSSPQGSSGKSRFSQVADSDLETSRQVVRATGHGVVKSSPGDSQPSLDADDDAGLATRDAALEHWASAAAAPLASKEPAQEPSSFRSRKVLALALVLTVGAGPVSRLFRRRTPAETGSK